LGPAWLSAGYGLAIQRAAEYHVLVLLSEAPDHAMRMSELAAQAIFTPRALTRVVELTKAGFQTLLGAYPPHLQSVRDRVIRHLRGLDVAAFTDVMERIAEEA
jgi:hypothetical protein